MGYQCIVGIDPGLTGGVAWLSTDGLMVMRMPVIKTGKETLLDMTTLLHVLEDWELNHVFVERQQPMPKQGVVSSGKTMMNYGLILGMLAGKRFPYTVVSPNVWKRAMRVPRDKKLARAEASKLFPNNADDWKLVRDDGLAEAALLAEHGRRELNIKFESPFPSPIPPSADFSPPRCADEGDGFFHGQR